MADPRIDPHLTDGEILAAVTSVGAYPVTDFTPWELGFLRACLLEGAAAGELTDWRHQILRNIAAARPAIARARIDEAVTVWSHRHPRDLTAEQETIQAELDVIAPTLICDLDADELGLIGGILHDWAREGEVKPEVRPALAAIATARPDVARERETTGATIWERRHPSRKTPQTSGGARDVTAR